MNNELIIPLAQLDKLSEIAKERYLVLKKGRAFPFTYAIPIPVLGSTDSIYQELIVDYRNDIGVYVRLSQTAKGGK